MRRSKIYYARMRATANKTGRKNEICLSRKKIRRLQKPVWRNEKYKKRVYTLLWRQGSNKVEKRETESSVSMQGTRLYWQSFEERLQSDTWTDRMTGYCTARNSCMAWVRGCRRTSWKTWGRKTKYSDTNTDKDKMHGKTETVTQIESRKAAGSLPLIHYVMCLLQNPISTSNDF